MTYTPPRITCWLLEAVLPADAADAIVGDLHEEYSEHLVPMRGEWAARWWFRWQVARSLFPLFSRSWQRASIIRASVAILCAGAAATVPATLLLMLRAFVLQQVPLKTTTEMSLAFAATWMAVVFVMSVGGTLAAARLLAKR